MLKHKKFLSLLLMLPVIGAFSCSKVKEDYQIHTKDEEVNPHLRVEGTLNKTEYDSTKNETLSLADLTIYVDNQDKTSDRINSKEEIRDGAFFVCSRDSLPTNTIIGSDYKARTNVESSDFTFYVAAAIKVDEQIEIFVSTVPYKVTIKNPTAIKPWVWYTVTAVIIFAVVAMVSFARHHKAKKEGNL